MRYNPDFRYLAGTVFFLVVWLVLYWRARPSRKSMLWSSLVLVWVSPIFESLNQDYWRPVFFLEFRVGWFVFGLESFILGFSMIGVSAGVFDLVHRRRKHSEITSVGSESYWRLAVAAGLAVGLILPLKFGFGMNSVHAQIVVCFVLAVSVIWRMRGHWKLPSLSASAGLTGLMAIFYYLYYLPLFPNIIREWWLEDILWGLYLGKVPIEEFLWGATNAMYLGPVIRYCMDANARTIARRRPPPRAMPPAA